MVICGKYINLNKITKIEHISLKLNRFLIFVILYSLQCKMRGICCLKKLFTTERSKGIFVRENLKNSIVNENALNSERSLMHYKGRPSNYLFQLFLTL